MVDGATLLSLIASAEPTGLNTQGLADLLRGIFAPLFLVAVSVVALFYLFTKEITRFVQFVALAVAVGVLFYVPNIIETLAKGMAAALGIA